MKSQLSATMTVRRRSVVLVSAALVGHAAAQGNPGNGAFGDTSDSTFIAVPSMTSTASASSTATSTSSGTPSLQDIANGNTSNHSNLILLIVVLAVAFIVVLVGAIFYNLKFFKGKLGGRDVFNPNEDPNRSDQEPRRYDPGLWTKFTELVGKRSPTRNRRSARDRDAWKGLHGDDTEEMWDDRLDDGEVHHLGTVVPHARRRMDRVPHQGPFGDDLPAGAPGNTHVYQDPFTTGSRVGGMGDIQSTVSLHAAAPEQGGRGGAGGAHDPPAYEDDHDNDEHLEDDHKAGFAYDYVESTEDDINAFDLPHGRHS